MTAPLGAVVGIAYDSRLTVEIGDALRTPTGRTYVVVSVRRQLRCKHRGRWHLRCLVVGQTPADALALPLHWYRRGA